ncbi:hypothetical protein BJ875DRAFT_37147 [Amylocarpus encephaloides]|uniref:DUF221-domain-containing protein n=1 Tax=Amylocarpus encephaloides TaxID=45428 RepID=A0A9P7YH50_9HELO|nr:hypothetical protein BJ875DRAFT_37147 [Amylocarpus encephaloides]
MSGPQKQRTKPPPNNHWDWITSMFKVEDEELIEKCGLDAFLFLRYQRTMLLIFTPMTFVNLPILLPVNYLGAQRAGQSKHSKSVSVSGLDKFAWGHVDEWHATMYWAHCMVAIANIIYVCSVIFFELRNFVRLRQAYLRSAVYMPEGSAATLLLYGIPKEKLTPRALLDHFRGLRARNVQINQDFGELNKKISKRNTIFRKLEVAETTLIRLATKAHKKNSGKESTREDPSQPAWQKYLKDNDRPKLHVSRHHWILACFGPKVDAIHWYRTELARLNIQIERDQEHTETFPLIRSAFIQFEDQAGAREAYTQPSEHFAERALEIVPSDVLWRNLDISIWGRWMREAVVICCVLSIILLWSFPISWIAKIANLPALVNRDKRSGEQESYFVRNIILPVSAAVLPVLILPLVFLIIPWIFDWLAEFSGCTTGKARQLAIQNYYFAFLFFQSVLLVVFPGGMAGLMSAIESKSLALRLAKEIPMAATYFFSYFIMQALSASSSSLLNIPGLISVLLLPKCNKTPRQKWEASTQPSYVSWGISFPLYTNFACIGLVYSTIAPLIIPFVIMTFVALWITQRYIILYIIRLRPDTGGLIYLRAINHTFTGLYVMELLLAANFHLKYSPYSLHACKIQTVIMVVTIPLTALYHVHLNRRFGPLVRHLAAEHPHETVLRDQEVGQCTYLPQLGFDQGTFGRKSKRPQLDSEKPKASGMTRTLGHLHPAIKAKTPTVWIPFDDLGISNDEIERTKEFGTISISNSGATLDEKGNVFCSTDPPDYSEDE